MKPCTDPYIFGPPVLGDDFYNQKELVNKTVSATNNLLLIGMRRIGKTSVLLAIENLIKKKDSTFTRNIPVLLDLEILPASYNAALKIFKNEINKKIPSTRSISIASTFEGVIQDLIKYLNDTGKNLLLMLDELGTLYDLEDAEEGTGKGIAQALINLKQGTTNVKVIASSSPFIISSKSPTLLSDMLNQLKFQSQYLKPFTDKETEKLCQLSKTDTANALSDEKIIKLIVKATGGHPFLTQKLCSCYLHEGDIKKAKQSLKDDIGEKPQFNEDIKNLDEDHQEVLMLLSDRELSTGSLVTVMKGISVRTMDRRLNILKELGLIEKRSGRWRIRNEFFQSWLNDQLMAEGAKHIRDKLSDLRNPTKPWKWSTFILAGILTSLGAVHLFFCWNSFLFPIFSWWWLIFMLTATAIVIVLESTIVIDNTNARRIMRWIFGVLLGIQIGVPALILAVLAFLHSVSFIK